jgi:hypothetical protein
MALFNDDDEREQLIDAGDLRRYRTEIPNILDDSTLSPNAVRLYLRYKRAASSAGACWQSIKTLSETIPGMSIGSVSKARAELIEKKWVREGAVYINGEEKPCIYLIDVWDINAQRYAAARKKKAAPTDGVVKVLTTEAEAPPPQRDDEIAKTPAAKGSRLRPDWTISPPLKKWIEENYPSMTPAQLQHQVEEFVDYWVGVAGQRGTKVDWDATFRNSMRMKFVPKGGNVNGNGQPTTKKGKARIDDEAVLREFDLEFEKQLHTSSKENIH